MSRTEISGSTWTIGDPPGTNRVMAKARPEDSVSMILTGELDSFVAVEAVIALIVEEIKFE